VHLVGFSVRLLQKTVDFCAQHRQWRLLRTLSSVTLQVTSRVTRGAYYRGCLKLLLSTCIGEASQTCYSDAVLRSEYSDNGLPWSILFVDLGSYLDYV